MMLRNSPEEVEHYHMTLWEPGLDHARYIQGTYTVVLTECSYNTTEKYCTVARLGYSNGSKQGVLYIYVVTSLFFNCSCGCGQW